MSANNYPDTVLQSQIFDHLNAHIAIIDQEWNILASNKSWDQFNDENLLIKRDEKGSNFRTMLQRAIELGNDYALKILLGCKKVVAGEQPSFSLNYPLLNTETSDWYKFSFQPTDSEHPEFIIIHENISAAVSAKKKKQEDRNRYQIQFEQSLDGILITDTQGHIIDANPAASDLLGWSRDELKGRSRQEIMDIQDSNYQQALANRKKSGTYQLEMNMFDKDKNKIPVEVTSRAYRNKTGKLRAIVSFRDISNRKQMERDLMKTKHFTESALNSIPGVFFVVDRKGDFVRWNNNFTSELGYSNQELSQMNALDLAVNEHTGKIEQGLNKAFKTGKATVEAKVKSKDGAIKSYFISGQRFMEEGNEYLVGAGIDITKQKEAEYKTRQSQLMMEQLFENAPAGIVIADTKNHIQRVNKSFEQIFGYTQEEAVGENINDLLVPETKMDEGERLSQVSIEGDKFQTETIRETKDGETVPVLIGGVPVELDGEIIAIYGIYLDISEQYKHKKEIESALREKESLLAELHHRVKNNLALIDGLIELQFYSAESDHFKGQLNDVKKRIMTIASTHEVLYQNGNFTHIPFDDFIHKIIQTGGLHTQSEENKMTLNIDVSPIFLDINQSIPCGLLLNELLSLILKQADPQKEEALTVALRKYGTNIHLIVEGNNIIHSAEIETEESMHTLLIKTLTRQLNGTFLWPNFDRDYQKFEFIFEKRSPQSHARELLNDAGKK